MADEVARKLPELVTDAKVSNTGGASQPVPVGAEPGEGAPPVASAAAGSGHEEQHINVREADIQ
eukprot:1904932-Pyramimonas_sp.AAC.1